MMPSRRQRGSRSIIIEGSGEELQARLQAEGANSPADIFVTVDGGRLHGAVVADLFQPVESAVLEERVPDAAQHPDNLWFGLTSRARVIFYRSADGAPEGVADYEDLGRADLGKTVCIRTSSNIYNVSLMAELIDALGEEAAEAWAAGLKANLGRDPQGGDTDQLKAVAAGECDLAVSNTYYWGRLLTSSNPADVAVGQSLSFIYPNQDNRGTHINISGAGVLTNAPNRDNADRVSWNTLVSDDAQRVLADSNNEFPVAPGVRDHGSDEGLHRLQIQRRERVGLWPERSRPRPASMTAPGCRDRLVPTAKRTKQKAPDQVRGLFSGAGAVGGPGHDPGPLVLAPISRRSRVPSHRVHQSPHHSRRFHA
jgi:iron(III) transport system substrate-binding protein